MLDVRLFANPVLRAGVVAALASSAAMVAVLFIGSQWLQLVEWLGPAASPASRCCRSRSARWSRSPFAPALAERTSPRLVLSGGLGVLAVGLGLHRRPAHDVRLRGGVVRASSGSAPPPWASAPP